MRVVLWVIGAGLVARTAVMAFDAAPTRLGPLEYSVIADHLNTGRGFTFEQYGTTYRAWKEPLYTVLLAGLMRWGGRGDLSILAFQWSCGIGAALVVAWLTRRLLGDPASALVAGLLVAMNPFLVYYDTHWIHPLSLDVLLFLLVTATILLAAWERRVRMRWSIIAGLVMGLALWERSALLVSGVAAWIAALCLAPRHDRGLMVRRAAIWLGVALLVIAPWLARNHHLFGRVLMTTDSAHVFWLGNNPVSNGTYSDMAGRRVIESADPAFLTRLHGAPELAQYDLFRAEAWRFITQHPRRFFELFRGKLWAFIWFAPNAGVQYTALEGWLYRAAYAALLLLGLCGFALWWVTAERRGRHQMVLVLSAVAGLAVVHALMAINMKHRVPWEMVLAIFAAQAVTRGGRQLSRFLHGSLLS